MNTLLQEYGSYKKNEVAEISLEVDIYKWTCSCMRKNGFLCISVQYPLDIECLLTDNNYM